MAGRNVRPIAGAIAGLNDSHGLARDSSDVPRPGGRCGKAKRCFRERHALDPMPEVWDGDRFVATIRPRGPERAIC
jgi:hypothetical protein